MLSVLLVVLSACDGNRHGNRQPAETESETPFTALGRNIYQSRCATCHQPDGQGLPGVYPTLHRTEWTLGEKGRLIRLALHGLEGPIEVKGSTYDVLMPSHAFLSNREMAAVLTFVRHTFGNEAAAITPTEVAAVRQASTQDGPWDPAQLRGRTGIPADTTATTAQ